MNSDSQRSPAKLGLQLLHEISIEAASAHSTEELVQRLINRVQRTLDVDVCSLYRLGAEGALYMGANIGLNPAVAAGIVLPVGCGLVGTIAATRLPLNLRRASEHPNYQHITDSGEENYQSFLGVPIFDLGKVVGVLVVQDRNEHGFTQDEESLLVTVAAQLSGRLPPLLRPPGGADKDIGERLIRGLSAAPGQCIGAVTLLPSEQVFALADAPESMGTVHELQQLADAVSQVQRELDVARDQLADSVSSSVLEVFEFYRHLLEGDQLLIIAQQQIEQGRGAFDSVRYAVDTCVAAFEEIEDSYIRSRAADIHHVGVKLMGALLNLTPPELVEGENLVLLGDDVSVTDMARFRPEQIGGIVCMRGSPQSHSVVLARALGIPAVTSTGPVDHVTNRQQIIVDGDAGVVLLSASAATVRSYRQNMQQTATDDANLLKDKDLPAETMDGVRVQMLVNTGLLADIQPGRERGAEGIGLYRSEIPFLAHTTFPTEMEQHLIYEQVLAAYAPLPVTMRTLDIGGDKQLPYLRIEEPNPALGWRGIRFSLDNPATLATQLRAMLRANRPHGNLRILLPMVTSVYETQRARELLDAVMEQLAQEGLAVSRPPLGIMVEVPATASQLSGHAPWIDFIAIGTNDLTQYLLAIDRTNPKIANAYDHLHPGVVRTVHDIIERARELDIESCVCGEMAADPKGAILLLGLGVRSLSMNAHSLPRIKALIRSIRSDDATAAAKRALQLDHADAVHQCLAEVVETAAGTTQPRINDP